MDKTQTANRQAQDDQELSRPVPDWWRSAWFWSAASLGPVYWLGYWSWTGSLEPVPQIDLQFLLIVLVYPLLEECVFRGLLQGQLRRVSILRQSWLGLTAANGVTSLVFAASHLVVRGPASLLVFFPSLVFGYAFDRTGSLWPSILLHVFYNAGFVVLLAS